MTPHACRSVRELLEMESCGLLDSADEHARLESHLAGCEGCSEVRARERSITESLAAVSRLRASVSVEERVMAAVRAEAARNPVRSALDRRQKAVLGGAALAATIGELAFWASLAGAIALVPGLRSGLATAVASIPQLGRPLMGLATAAAEVALVLGGAALTVLDGLALLLPAPGAMAGAFVLLVSFLTFIAVRRDLHRSPAAARGLR